MDVQSGLKVASMFGDFRNFRQLYLAFSESGALSMKEFSTKEELVSVIERNDFTFLCGLLNNQERHPENDIEYLAFTTALDSIIWSLNTQSLNLSEIVFPKCFALSHMALRLTHKLNSGESIADRQAMLGQVLRELDRRM